MAGVAGRSGRKAQKLKLHKLHGTDREDRHAKNVPDPIVSAPPCPKSLTGLAREEWDRITQLLIEVGCVSELDMAEIAAYCREWSKYTKANDRLDNLDDYITKSTKGTKIPHPLLRVSDRALANMLRICQDFGLSPAARSRLDMESAAKDDPLADLIRRAGEKRSG
jgi:P27 family predicted phage terminase small subunit